MANTVASTPTTEYAPEDTVDDSHIHYDVGYKAAFSEIASLFEDIQADLRIITDRGDDRSKGIYTREADTVANNPANIAQAARDYINLQQSGILDLVNAEVGNPTNLGNTSSANYNAIRNSTNNPGGYQGGNQYTRQAAGFGNTELLTGADGKQYYEGTIPLDQITPADGTGKGNVVYNYEDTDTRILPIQTELLNILKTAAESVGVDVEITSGGQVPKSEGGINGVNRIGSNRHDKGYAADCRLFTGTGENRERLYTTNPDQLPIMIKFAQACRDAGATAIGLGNGYMKNRNIHVDIAWKGDQAGIISDILPNRYWGGGSFNGTKTSAANAPQYLVSLMAPGSNTA